MEPKKLQQLRNEIKHKLSESLPNLNEVLKKYRVLEGTQIEITFRVTEAQEALPGIEGQELLLSVIDSAKSQQVLTIALSWCPPEDCPPSGNWIS